MAEVMLVSTKGQITIPAAVRAKFGINAGDKIIGELSNNAFVIRKPIDFFSLKGCFSGGHIPDNEEEILTPEMGRRIMERE